MGRIHHSPEPIIREILALHEEVVVAGDAAALDEEEQRRGHLVVVRAVRAVVRSASDLAYGGLNVPGHEPAVQIEPGELLDAEDIPPNAPVTGVSGDLPPRSKMRLCHPSVKR